jgi:hypothetical protein
VSGEPDTAGAERTAATYRVLWFGILGPPLVWIARIVVSYVLVPYACAADSVLALHLVSIVALAAIGTIARIAWRNGGASALRAPDPRAEPPPPRFLALFGLGSAAFFFLVVAAEGAMNALIHPCLA